MCNRSLARLASPAASLTFCLLSFCLYSAAPLLHPPTRHHASDTQCISNHMCSRLCALFRLFRSLTSTGGIVVPDPLTLLAIAHSYGSSVCTQLYYCSLCTFVLLSVDSKSLTPLALALAHNGNETMTTTTTKKSILSIDRMWMAVRRRFLHTLMYLNCVVSSLGRQTTTRSAYATHRHTNNETFS